MGSLAGAAHLLKDNTGVLRPAQSGQKPLTDQKGKSWLHSTSQCQDELGNHGLSILCLLRVLSQRCQKNYHRDNWLVAAKRS